MIDNHPAGGVPIYCFKKVLIMKGSCYLFDDLGVMMV